MKAHKYWSLGALAAMIGTFLYRLSKNMKTGSPNILLAALFSANMIMAVYWS